MWFAGFRRRLSFRQLINSFYRYSISTLDYLYQFSLSVIWQFSSKCLVKFFGYKQWIVEDRYRYPYLLQFAYDMQDLDAVCHSPAYLHFFFISIFNITMPWRCVPEICVPGWYVPGCAPGMRRPLDDASLGWYVPGMIRPWDDASQNGQGQNRPRDASSQERIIHPRDASSHFFQGRNVRTPISTLDHQYQYIQYTV
jgi:hypothetical protein